MAKVCGIYKITNTLNGKVYIGQSIDIRERFYEHKRKLRLHQHCNRYLQNAWDKHGEYFEFEVIEECSLDDLDKREMYWIGRYNSDDQKRGYNIMGGGQANRAVAEQTKAMISKPVLCIETGEVYPSVAEAQRQTGICNISLACTGKMCHSGGYHWCFEEDATPEHIEAVLNRTQRRCNKAVVCLVTGEVFDSMTEAARKHGVSIATISVACKRNSRNWRFYEEVGA